MSKRRLILLFVTLILWTSLVAPAAGQEATVEPTAAAESVPDAPESAPVSGAGTLVLLMGLGAVVVVGGVAILRENAKRSAQ